MGWFNSVKNPKLKNIKRQETNTPKGLWKKCSGCNEIYQTSKLEENFQVCPLCGHHYRMSADQRIELLCDKDTFVEFGQDLSTSDPLDFQDRMTYKERLEKAKEKTSRHDGVVVGKALIMKHPVIIACMDFAFMGGSMGVVTGEKIALAMEMGLKEKCAVLVVSCSGGARMQEGILSLMQMAKTSAARKKLKEAKIPYISLLTDPTTGGCAASFSMLGDVNIAEPKALIGFAGPRVIEQSIRQTLPVGFQRSEFLKEHGFIDRIIERKDLKKEIAFFLDMFRA